MVAVPLPLSLKPIPVAGAGVSQGRRRHARRGHGDAAGGARGEVGGAEDVIAARSRSTP